jgi:hypothetical protein
MSTRILLTLLALLVVVPTALAHIRADLSPFIGGSPRNRTCPLDSKIPVEQCRGSQSANPDNFR